MSALAQQSVNPIPTGGGQIIPTYYYWPPQSFSPSGITRIEAHWALLTHIHIEKTYEKEALRRVMAAEQQTTSKNWTKWPETNDSGIYFCVKICYISRVDNGGYLTLAVTYKISIEMNK